MPPHSYSSAADFFLGDGRGFYRHSMDRRPTRIGSWYNFESHAALPARDLHHDLANFAFLKRLKRTILFFKLAFMNDPRCREK